MSEYINYHRCDHSSYGKLVKDLIQYGACEVGIGSNSGDYGKTVAREVMEHFTSSQKKEHGVIKVEFMGYVGHDGLAKYVLITSKNSVKRRTFEPNPLTRNQMEIGMRVKIHTTSEYFGQSKTDGTVFAESDSVGWWRIRWDDGHSNSYRPKDLCLAGYVNNKQAIGLLKKD